MTHLDVSAQVGKTARINLKAGQSVEIKVDALPGETFWGKVQTVGGATSHEFWDENARHKFDVAVQLDHADPRLHPGFAVRLNILGDNLSRVVFFKEKAAYEI